MHSSDASSPDGARLDAARPMVMLRGMGHEIEHDTRERRFVLHLAEGRAVLDYEPKDGATLDMTHTWVPPEARGHGVGGRLVRGALAWARDHDRKVIPTCTFVAAFIEDNPEYGHLVARP